MTSGELERWLKSQGCTVYPERGKGGHRLVRLGDRKTVLPMHGVFPRIAHGDRKRDKESAWIEVKRL